MNNSLTIEDWKQIIKSRKETLGYTWDNIDMRMGVSSKTRLRLCSNLPNERSRVLDLCYALEYSVDETNDLLDMCNMQRLYSKNPDDAIWIYIINTNTKYEEECSAEYLFIHYSHIYEKLLKETIESSKSASTTIIKHKLLEAKRDEDFENCIRENIKSFREKYCRLESFICKVTGTKSMHEALSTLPNEEKKSAYSRIYNIRSTRTQNNRNLFDIPKRPFIIALGLALGFDVYAINEMLSICQFDCLGGTYNDVTETAIYWLLLYLYHQCAPLKASSSGGTRIIPPQDKVNRMLEEMNINIFEEYNANESPDDFIYRVLTENYYENIPRIIN